MDEKKRDLGVLGKLAAIATALTAILSLLFMLFPSLRPGADSGKPAPVADAVLRESAGPGLAEPSGVAPGSLDPAGAASIREVLAAHEAAKARAAIALAPLDLDPPGFDASPGEQAGYLQALAQSYAEAVRAIDVHIADMEGIGLSATPEEFRQVMHAHLGALRDNKRVLLHAEVLLTRTALDVQTKGPGAYREFFSILGGLGPKAVDSDAAVEQSWADVAAAAASLGIE